MSEKKWVGRSGYLLIFFYSTQMTQMHTLAVNMFIQHNSCVYKGKLITCEKFVLFALYQVLFCLVNIFFRKCGKKKSLQSGGFREGRLGYKAKKNLS